MDRSIEFLLKTGVINQQHYMGLKSRNISNLEDIYKLSPIQFAEIPGLGGRGQSCLIKFLVHFDYDNFINSDLFHFIYCQRKGPSAYLRNCIKWAEATKPSISPTPTNPNLIVKLAQIMQLLADPKTQQATEEKLEEIINELNK